MRKGKVMKKRYWRDVGFFAGGTFLGGWVLGIVAKIMGKA
jgi:hypothetical protein